MTFCTPFAKILVSTLIHMLIREMGSKSLGVLGFSFLETRAMYAELTRDKSTFSS